MTDQTAPGRLELVRRFVNTRDVEEGTDELEAPESATAWLRRDRLIEPATQLERTELRRVTAVREALRELLLANNAGRSAPQKVIRELNRQAAEAEIGLRFDDEGSALVTRCGGADAAITTLLAIVHESMRDGTWARLKACPADDCLWAFYDHSRNRSGTWCSMEECGNRAKARAHRERKRAKPGSQRAR